jgi:hypothetical protein
MFMHFSDLLTDNSPSITDKILPHLPNQVLLSKNLIY